MGLSIELNRGIFRSLWYINRKRFHPSFKGSKNWALHGLFWLSKDLYEKDMNFDTVLEHDAKEIAIYETTLKIRDLRLYSTWQRSQMHLKNQIFPIRSRVPFLNRKR